MQPTMQHFSKSVSITILAIILLIVSGTGFRSQGQDDAPRPPRSRADETLEMWNAIGNKLVAMAKDFPEDKYDFKVQKDERTFALNLLHAAALDYVLIRRISQGRVPGMLIRIMGAIGRTATIARNFPAHCGGRSIQASGHLTKRRIGSDSS